VVAILRFGKYDESSTSNKQAAARYTSLESNVRRQLSLYRKDRIDADKYMDWLETKYEELFLSAPLLSPEAYDKYFADATRLGLTVPCKYKATIDINPVYEQCQVQRIADRTEIRVNDNDPVAANHISVQIEEVEEVDEVREGSGASKNSSSSDPKPSGGDLQVSRTKTSIDFPDLNQYSDKMLEYEMRRFFRFR